MNYRREIDGLRAVAVSAVILFHASPHRFSGGFVGVDVFFVISGYLISGILLDEMGMNVFSVLQFYERRARRILPALCLVIAACIPVALLLMSPEQVSTFASSIVSVVFFRANYFFMDQVGYFGPDAETQPLLHIWSLAVEEQFYLIFPVILLLMHRLHSMVRLRLIVLLAAISFAYGVFSGLGDAGKTFYSSPGRFWELLIGALCAHLVRMGNLRANQLASLLGFGLIVGSIFILDGKITFLNGLTFIPVIGTALVILFAGRGTWTAAMLSMRGCVGLGLISYSAYLWHVPLFAFARLYSLGALTGMQRGVLIALALGLAWLTWAYVEQPFRRRPVPVLATRGRVFGAALVVGVVFASIGFGGQLTDGYTALLTVLNPTRVAEFKLIAEASTHVEPEPPGTCLFHVTQLTPQEEARAVDCARQMGRGVLVLGDSHAIDLMGIVTRQQQGHFILGVTSGGCRPHTPSADCPYESVLDFIQNHPQVFDLVIFEQAGFYLLSSNDYPQGDRRLFDDLGLRQKVPDYAVNDDNVNKNVDYLSRLALFVPVVWFGPRIEPHIPLNIILRTGCDGDIPVRGNLAGNFARLDAALQARLQGTGIGFLAQNVLFGYQFPRDFGGCDGLLWSDGDHLSDAGEKAMAERADVVSAALKVVGTTR